MVFELSPWNAPRKPSMVFFQTGRPALVFIIIVESNSAVTVVYRAMGNASQAGLSSWDSTDSYAEPWTCVLLLAVRILGVMLEVVHIVGNT